MTEVNGQEYLPKKLVQYLVLLWISLINVGVDFGLLMKATRPAGFLLIIFLVIAIGFSVHFTRGLIGLFKAQQANRSQDRTPDIV